MIAIGDRVVYTGERSPDYPDAAYRGTVVAVDDGMVTVRWDECAEWDAEECTLPAGELAYEAGASGAGG
jgi:hypothetical protein